MTFITLFVWKLYVPRSLVRSGIEYGSTVWTSPYQTGQIQHLNKVQHNFLRHLLFKFGSNVSVISLGLELGLHSLTSRRKFNDVSFIYKLLNNKIILYCPEILEKVSWRVPAFHSRSTTTFHIVSFHSQSYSFIKPLRVCDSIAFDFNFDYKYWNFDLYVLVSDK